MIARSHEETEIHTNFASVSMAGLLPCTGVPAVLTGARARCNTTQTTSQRSVPHSYTRQWEYVHYEGEDVHGLSRGPPRVATRIIIMPRGFQGPVYWTVAPHVLASWKARQLMACILLC